MNGILDGKRALITGGGRGIGAAIALRLARDGAAVAIGYGSDRRAAEATAARIGEHTGGKAVTLQADTGRPEEAERLVEEAAGLLGGLDILVNNAGVITAGPIESLTPEAAARVIDVNVLGPLLLSRAAVRHLGDGGRIVNIGSSLGERVPSPGLAAYSASKAAITGLTKALARELGPRGITVNEVAPGSTDTRMNPQDGPGAEDQRRGSALGRFGAPEEIAEAVAHLVSPRAGFTTGTRLGVDGGSNA
ncbi:SDR family oxidoreductase [Nocardiopsis sp. N85]|uniref:SDR family NAD(P)-dependent oxidoreductase n=1 Tax=Nocardiopsis sp. N85 TaxID=3029400 RepID=UPI00237F19F2|nr:SDR family oxidoreductase [Nocardiopsis sp. N85]MDE3720379.1 SDR family oxidoreductase [Nocardiopsis sp. N85]